MRAKTSPKINQVTIKLYPERAWDNIIILSSFPGVIECRTLKENKPNPLKTKDLQFRGKKDFNTDKFIQESKRLYIQSYVDLINREANDAKDILSHMKLKTLDTK